MKIGWTDDGVAGRAQTPERAPIRNETVDVSGQVQSDVLAELITPFGEDSCSKLDCLLIPRRPIEIRKNVEENGHMAVDLRRRRRGEAT